MSMFEHLVKVNGLEDDFDEKYGLTEIDIKFIKEQIAGPLDSDKNNDQVRTQTRFPSIASRTRKSSKIFILVKMSGKCQRI